MRIVRIEQNSEAWFDYRRGRIGGSKAGGIKPLSRGKNKGLIEGTAGFWKLVAERLAIENSENERDRGHRLEPEAMQRTNELFKLNLAWKTEEDKTKPGIWISDHSEDMYISPDAAEDTETPTYAAESKAFTADKHLRIIFEDMLARKSEDYNPFGSIPSDNQDQVVDYFVINDNCNTLYWTLINDCVALPELEHYVIVVKREHVQAQIDALKDTQLQVLARLEEVIKQMTGGE